MLLTTHPHRLWGTTKMHHDNCTTNLSWACFHSSKRWTHFDHCSTLTLISQPKYHHHNILSRCDLSASIRLVRTTISAGIHCFEWTSKRIANCWRIQVSNKQKQKPIYPNYAQLWIQSVLYMGFEEQLEIRDENYLLNSVHVLKKICWNYELYVISFEVAARNPKDDKCSGRTRFSRGTWKMM